MVVVREPREPGLRGHVDAIQEILLAAAAAYFIGAFCWIAFRTLAFPFRLEWVEGTTLDTVQRILKGQPLYTRPSIAYTPQIYTPLYYGTAAVLARIIGAGFLAGRVVSFLSTLASGAVIFAFAAHERVRSVYCLIGTGLFFATFEASGRWFHLARVDSLFLFLLLSACFLVRCANSPAVAVSAGIIFGLAVLTKQSALVAFALATAAVVVGTTLVFDHNSGRWFSFFVWELPARHPIRWSRAISLWTTDLLPQFWPSVLAAIFGIASAFKRGRTTAWFYATFVISMFATSAVSRVHAGGYLNVLMPAFAGLAVVFPLALDLLLSRHSPVAHPAGRGVRAGAGLLAIIQFALLVYDPRGASPGPHDEQAGRRYAAYLDRIQGEVLVVDERAIPTLTGRHHLGLGSAYRDLVRGGPSQLETTVTAEIRAAIRRQRFAAIVLASRDPRERYRDFARAISENYEFRGVIFRDPNVFFPVSGARLRSNFVFVPKKEPDP
jgi:hypothetical protein